MIATPKIKKMFYYLYELYIPTILIDKAEELSLCKMPDSKPSWVVRR